MSESLQTFREVLFTYQPVFDTSKKAWGYALSFIDDDASKTFTQLSLEKTEETRELLALIGNCPDKRFCQARVIIPFTEEAILQGDAYALPPSSLYVQLKDSTGFNPALTTMVQQLVEKGYAIAIDDYMACPENMPLYRFSSIFMTCLADREERVTTRQQRLRDITEPAFLAKNIASQKQFQQARSQGYQLFQGVFFQKPKAGKIRTISANEAIRFEILEQLCAEEFDFDTLSNSIAKDASISVRLLKLLNSPAYGPVQEIHSLKQAAVYLGHDHLKNWLRVILLTDSVLPQTTRELLRTSLLRAKFLEIISNRAGVGNEADRLFLLGLFSLLDSMYQMPMNRIMDHLEKLNSEIKMTLNGEITSLTDWLNLSVSMSNSDWPELGSSSARLNLSSDWLMPSYLSALTWVDTTLQVSTRL
ncbi:MAG: hypothetical protein CSA20_08005 [Deltaproteobacteria bacterium]|nr:MAG: hypothetical protein CSA20_08005 [Deltaproteobacteria bacterium]